MNGNCPRYPVVIGLCFGLLVPTFGAPRDGEWAKVADTIHQKLPQTALALLQPIEAAAFADQS